MSMTDDNEEIDWLRPNPRYPYGIGLGNPGDPYDPVWYRPPAEEEEEPPPTQGPMPPSVAGIKGQPSPGGGLAQAQDQGVFDGQDDYSVTRDKRRALLDRRKQALAEASKMLTQDQAGQVNLPLLAFGSALLKPTRTGSFFESLGGAGEAAVTALSRQRAVDHDKRLKALGLQLQGDDLEDRFLADNEKFLQTRTLIGDRYGRYGAGQRGRVGVGTPVNADGTPSLKPFTEGQLATITERVYKQMYGDQDVPPEQAAVIRGEIRRQLIQGWRPTAQVPKGKSVDVQGTQVVDANGDVIEGSDDQAVGGGGASVPGGPPLSGDPRVAQNLPPGQFPSRPAKTETRKLIPTPAQRELFGLPEKEGMYQIQYDRQGKVIRMTHVGDVAGAGSPPVPLEERNRKARSHGIPGLEYDPYEQFDPKIRGDIQKQDNSKLAKVLEDYDKALESVPKLVQQADRFLELNKDVETGWATGQWGNRVGYFGSKAQEMSAIANEMARYFRQPGEGTISNYDAQMFTKMTFGMGSNRDANQNMAAMYKAAKKMEYDKAQFMREYAGYWSHLRGAQSAWERYANSPQGRILVTTKEGPRINPRRQAWREFFRSEEFRGR